MSIARTAYERWLAPLYLWSMSVPAIRNRRAPYLADLPYRFTYSPVSRGFGRAQGLAALRRLDGIRGKTVLIVGDDTPGTLMQQLVKAGAHRVLCIDLYGRSMPGYPDRWRDITKTTGGVAQFAIGDGSRLGLSDHIIDTICCESVLEHVRGDDLEAMLDEFRRVLRPCGLAYVLWGPLWYSHGGPHIGALGYDHLLMPADEFRAAADRVGNWWQSWFVRDDLFNRLTIDDYLKMFDSRFEIVRLLLGGSLDSERYPLMHPTEWCRLRASHSERALKVRHGQIIVRRL